MEFECVVIGYSTDQKAGKLPKYKVLLKSLDGFHRITLTGETEAIKKGYPLGESVTVEIRESQTLDEFTGEKE